LLQINNHNRGSNTKLLTEPSAKQFGQTIQFALKDAAAKAVSRCIAGQTRPETKGKQKAQFILTPFIQSQLKLGKLTPELTFEATQGKTAASFDLTSLKSNMKLVLYYTE